ncbi:uncharacterized protein JCM15063_006478 [Sporobolomyces koalae]|uniref:uncharacterized protein n=1 Tax=Sporobolomyces koalae TaxID=500713 RepID=UPI00317B7FB8
MFRPLVLLALAACAHLTTATISVTQGKLSIVDSVASSASHSATFSSSASPSPRLRDLVLSATDTIKLSFQVQDEDSGVPLQPHQAVVSWQPVDHEEQKEYGRQYASVVKVRSTGKARWELDLSKAPTSLLSLSRASISATLLLGDPKHRGLSIPLGTFKLANDLVLPFPYPPNEDLPAHWQVEKYSQQPRIDWTFRGAEKQVNSVVSLLGLGLVLSPWIALLSIFFHLKPSLSLRSPTVAQTVLLLSLVSFEALLVVYWVQLRLIPTLPYFGAIALVIVLSGKKALGQMRATRLARERDEMGKTE